jgi:hypothetical protein
VTDSAIVPSRRRRSSRVRCSPGSLATMRHVPLGRRDHSRSLRTRVVLPNSVRPRAMARYRGPRYVGA